MKFGVLAADGFQDAEYFLPKVEIEKLGVQTEVISLTRAPIEIYSFFSRIGLLFKRRLTRRIPPTTSEFSCPEAQRALESSPGARQSSHSFGG